MLSLNDTQRARAIHTLLSVNGLGQLWSPDGPTPIARTLRDRSAMLETRECELMNVAWALWDGSHALCISKLAPLGRRCVETVSSLVDAMCSGPIAVDAWIARVEEEEASVTRVRPSAPAPSRTA